MFISKLFKKNMVDYLIVGLGNPGEKYAKQRHNVGFMAVDYLLNQLNLNENWQKSKKAQALNIKTTFLDKQIEFLKPQTYMNLSGTSVAYIAKKNNLKPNQIIVIYDELDLEFGDLRVKKNGGSAGHNGIKSIIGTIGSEFWRIRIGIKNELREKMEADKFVLSRFGDEEIKLLQKKIFPQVEQELKNIILR